MCTGFRDHLWQHIGVLEHGARLEVIVVERHVFVVLHEEGRAQRVEQAYIVDVRVGVVDEHAGFHVASGVDVQVATAACNASAHVLAVVLEVEREQRLFLAHLANEVVHVLTLFGRGDELCCGAAAHRHKVEVPAEECALIDHPVDVFLRGDGICIGLGPAAGDAKGKVVLAQELHRALDLLVRTLATAGVGGVLVALGRDGGNKVGHADHILAELLVDERGIGKAQERAVGMLLTDADEVGLAYQRLTAGVDVHVRAQRFALGDDGVDVFKREVLLVAVFGSPAARAMQVACARGVEKDGPGDVALVLIAVLLLLGPSQDIAVDDEGLEQARTHLGIKLEDTHDKVVPVAAALDDVGEGLALRGENVVRHELVDKVHDLINVIYGVFVQIVDELVERSALGGLLECHGYPPDDIDERPGGAGLSVFERSGWGRRCGNESLVDSICEIAPPGSFATGIVPKRDIFNKRRNSYCVYSTKESKFVSFSTKVVAMANTKTEKGVRVDRRVLRTRKAILAAFEKLLEKKDLSEITISSIAREADIDRKTFYLHFGSIDGLLDAIAEDSVEYIVNTVEEALSGHQAESAEDVQIAADTFFATVNRVVSQNIAINKRLFELLPPEEFITRIRKPLERALIEGNIVPSDLPDELFEYYLSFLLSGIVGIYRAWVLSDGSIPIEQVSAVANELTQHGLMSLEGRLDA